VAVEDIQSNVVGSAFVATRIAPPVCACPEAGAPDAHHINSGTAQPARIRAPALVRTRRHLPDRHAATAGAYSRSRAARLPELPEVREPGDDQDLAGGSQQEKDKAPGRGDKREARQPFFFNISTK
jgi:hypothetical protein